MEILMEMEMEIVIMAVTVYQENNNNTITRIAHRSEEGLGRDQGWDQGQRWRGLDQNRQGLNALENERNINNKYMHVYMYPL